MAEEAATTATTSETAQAPDKGASDSQGAEKAAAQSAEKSAGGDKSQESASGDKKPDGWWTAVPDEKAREWAKRHPSPADAVMEGFKLRQKLSNAITPLGEKATPEEVADYRRKMGVPLKPEGYKLEGLEGKEPSAIEKAFQGEMAKAFYEANIPEGAARKLNQVYNGFVAEFQRSVAENDKADAEKWETALKRKWGSDFEINTKAAATSLAMAAAETGNEDLKTLSNLVVDVGGKKTLLGSFPLFTELAAFWGRRLMESPAQAVGEGEARDASSELDSLYNLHRSPKREDQDKYRHPDTQKRIRELESKFPRRNRTRAA